MYQGRRRQRQTTHTFPAPSGGWVKNQTLLGANPRTAEVLDNFFPTAQGARLRRGSVVSATVSGAVIKLMTYEGGGGTNKLFASTASSITDITSPADETVAETPEISGFSNGDWSSVHYSTTAGDYVIGVNGEDYAFLHDGTSFAPIAGATVSDLGFDAKTADFSAGETVTGGTSGATATVLAQTNTSATAGVLRLGAITGMFQDNEALTSASGAAVADGTTSSGSAISITGIDTTDLIHVWQHQRRLWFIEKTSLSAWYLPVNQIGGAATEFLMGALFRKGGSLLFGTSWTIDTGEGMDDMAIFVTTEGEMAVYAGTDPASASTWGLRGLYDIGKPLGKNAWFRNAGDIQVLTKDGIISVSAAMQLDRTGMQQQAMTFPIEDAWQDVVANSIGSFPFSCTLWPTQTMLVVGVPSVNGEDATSLVANARTGAWCRFIGWDVQDSQVFGDNLYFGTADGRILQAEASGADDGASYVARWAPKCAEMGGPQRKFATQAGLLWRSTKEDIFTAQCFSDYQISNWASAPDVQADSESSVWGTAVWGTSTWGETQETMAFQRWRGVNGQGFSLAPGIQISSGNVASPTVEIVAALLHYETGRAF